MTVAYRLFTAALLVGTLVGHAGHSSHAAPPAPVLPTWTALTPLAVDQRATLQSEPAIGLHGNTALIVWTDSRNALPDVYAAHMLSGTLRQELRVTNFSPHFSGQSARNPSVVVADGWRAFVAWSDAQHVFITRLPLRDSSEPIMSARVTTDFSEWWATAHRPRIASDDRDVWLNLVWTDFRNGIDGRRPGDIYAARCDGINVSLQCTHLTKVNDDHDPGNAQTWPDISRNGSQVVAVWEDTREAGLNYPRIYASISNDGGQTWGVNMRVNKRLDGSAPGLRDAATRPAVTHAPDGSIYVVWEHRSGAPTAPPDIYVARWDGTSWSAPWRVDAAPPRVRSVNPAIAANAVGVFVAWQDYRNGNANADIYTARWDGSTWTEIPAVVHPRAQALPALRASNAEVRLAWQDERAGQADVYTAVWNGSAWISPTLLHGNPARLPYQMYPALASGSGQNWALFTDQREGAIELYVSRMISFTRWATPTVLPTQVAVGGSVSEGSGGLALTGDGRLHAVWSDYHWRRGTRAMYAVLSGTTWSPPVFLSRAVTDGEMLATVATFGNTIAAAWTHYNRNTRQSNLYTTWNTGSGWITETAVLTTPRNNTWQIPFALAVDASNVYVAWSQPRGSQGEVLLLARRSLSGAGSWSYHRIDQEQNVSWCPNYAPALRVDAAGGLHVAWAGCQRRSSSNSSPVFALYAYSGDQGATWSAPLRLGQTNFTKPALAAGSDGRVMVVFPSTLVGNGSFIAAMVQSGTLAFTRTIAADAGWVGQGTYGNRWYAGDSAGSVAFDPSAQRFVIAIIDRSSGRAPQILTTSYSHLGLEPVRPSARAFFPIYFGE